MNGIRDRSLTARIPQSPRFHYTIGRGMVDIALIAMVMGAFRASPVIGVLNVLLMAMAGLRARKIGRIRQVVEESYTVGDWAVDLVWSYLCAFVLIGSILVTLVGVSVLGWYLVGSAAPLLGVLAAGCMGCWVGRAVMPCRRWSRGPEIVWVGELVERESEGEASGIGEDFGAREVGSEGMDREPEGLPRLPDRQG